MSEGWAANGTLDDPGNETANSSLTPDPAQIPPEYLAMSPDTRNCVIAYCIIFVVAATGNLSVFFSVLQQLRRTKSRISVLILHLSIADLVVTFGVIPLEVIWRITIWWYGGNVLCKISKFFHGFGLYLSSMVLICISLDRYMAIIHPLRLTDARRRGRKMLASAWITAAICSSPQLLIFRVEKHPQYPSFHQCISMGFFSPTQELIYTLFSVSFMYFVPLAIVLFTYVMILIKISRKSKQHRESGKNSQEANGRIQLRRSDASNHMERAKSRTLRLTVVIVIVFVLCWTPYAVITLWYMVDRQSASKVNRKVQDALFIMAVANSCLNPLVYGSYTRECRKSMTNCCGLSRCVDAEEESRRRGGGPGGLRRQSQLKIKYTASKRSNASSYRTGGFSPGPSPTIATLIEPSPCPSPTPGGGARFFDGSPGTQRRTSSGTRNGRTVKILVPAPTESENRRRNGSNPYLFIGSTNPARRTEIELNHYNLNGARRGNSP